MQITTRAQLPAYLTNHRLTRLGVELGVASGRYSEHLLQQCPVRRLYSIDAWAGDRGHDIAQCDAATRRLSKYGTRSIVIRARFEEALALFPDPTLDFVYIDGYAHEGNEAGQTLTTWWQKVRPGGILAGHDYHPRWEKNVAAVDAFCAGDAGRKGEIEEFFTTREDEFPSWVVRKGE
ncbi:MAG: class I SAM-dependent methyltransferase [Verrucomicrobiales bacterium]|nr:class I SAM-dependent methyltransferase [Verrucomicrobiales bacterium]